LAGSLFVFKAGIKTGSKNLTLVINIVVARGVLNPAVLRLAVKYSFLKSTQKDQNQSRKTINPAGKMMISSVKIEKPVG
jgi:hypothetical protein